MVGQSRHFWKVPSHCHWPSETVLLSLARMQYAWSVVGEFFPQLQKEHSAEEMYRALNVVTPSLIRVDADEVTAPHLPNCGSWTYIH